MLLFSLSVSLSALTLVPAAILLCISAPKPMNCNLSLSTKSQRQSSSVADAISIGTESPMERSTEGKVCLPLLSKARVSLATFWKSTRLSPSAVCGDERQAQHLSNQRLHCVAARSAGIVRVFWLTMPACEKFMICPSLLQLRKLTAVTAEAQALV